MRRGWGAAAAKPCWQQRPAGVNKKKRSRLREKEGRKEGGEGGACLDLDVGGLPLRPAEGLVDHDAGVGQREPLPLKGKRQRRWAAGG